MQAWLHAATSTLLALVPFLAIFGNGLVMLAVHRERSLQTVTNLLIVSLAVSDLLVAVCVMTFGIYVQMHSVWDLGVTWCNVYLASDVMCSTASILNLLAISLDRYMAISHPLAYAHHDGRGGRAMISITIVWGLSILVGIPILWGINNDGDNAITECMFTNPMFNIISSLLSFFLPCAGMIVLYAVIFKRLRQRERARSQRKANKMEHDRISSALLGGARIASQMGKHFKNRTDQILLEISFQTSSYPSLSDTSEDQSSSTMNGGIRLSPPCRISTPRSAPLPTPLKRTEIMRDPSQKEAQTQPDDDSSRIDSSGIYRSFGEHLQELFPFIDSISRRGSQEEERSSQEESRHHMYRKHRRTQKTSESECARPLVHATQHHSLDRSASKRNGVAGRSADEMRKERGEERRHREKLPVKESLSQPLNTHDVPKIHRSVTTAPVSKESTRHEHHLSASMYECKADTDYSIGDSVKMARKELWKRVTSGWKARPSRQLVKKATKQMRREHKATVTLAVVLGVFLAFWLPFFTLHFINSVSILLTGDPNGIIASVPLFITTWLGYINSSINPLIYTVFDQRFRNAFKAIICCTRRRR